MGIRPETAALEILEGLLRFLAGVHDEGAMARHGLASGDDAPPAPGVVAVAMAGEACAVVAGQIHDRIKVAIDP